MSFFKSLTNALNPNTWLTGALGKTDGGLGNAFGGILNDLSGASDSARQQYNYNKALQEQSQKFNAEQAKIQREWEAEQANTAVQRRSADLQKAGINPVLAAGASADTGAGATATSPSASTSTGTPVASPLEAIRTIVDTMNSAKKTDAEVKQIKADIKNSTDETGAKVRNLDANTNKTTYDNNVDKENNVNGNTPYPIKIIKNVKNSARKELKEYKEKAKQPGWTGFKYKARNWLLRQ